MRRSRQEGWHIILSKRYNIGTPVWSFRSFLCCPRGGESAQIQLPTHTTYFSVVGSSANRLVITKHEYKIDGASFITRLSLSCAVLPHVATQPKVRALQIAIVQRSQSLETYMVENRTVKTWNITCNTCNGTDMTVH